MNYMERVEYLWGKYRAYSRQAEQHEFVHLLMLDLTLNPAYNDLHSNYDEEHAKIFIRGIEKVLTRLGVEFDD